MLLGRTRISAQYFHSLPPGFNLGVDVVFEDSTDGNLYASGSFWQLGNGVPMNGIAKWNGTNWDSLAFGIGGYGRAIVRYKGLLYVGGSFGIKDSNGVYIPSVNLSMWNGVHWLFPPGGVPNSLVTSLRIIDTNLYVTGTFTSIGGISAQGIAYFDGTTWHGFPNVATTVNFNGLGDCIFYNNQLYIAGDFEANPSKNDIARFNGTNWVGVGGGFSGFNSWTNCLEIFQGQLYVGGYFFTSQGDPGNNIAIWNGTSWSQPASGAMPSNVGNMLVFQNELYIVGQINDVSGIPVTGIAKWDGINWHSLGANFDINPTCLSSLGNDLFLGGGFHVIDGDTMNHVTRYSPPLAIEENVGESKDITIIVNPSNGNISFTSLFYPIQTIHLFDLSGKVVFTSEKIFENFYQCKLNSVNGIYITEVIMNGNIYRSKIAMIH